MKTIAILLLALTSAPAQASVLDEQSDRIILDATGGRTVLRAVEHLEGVPDINQRLKVTEDGRLRYDFNEQSEGTKEYHRTYCAQLGLDPATEGTVIFDVDAVGWHCSSVQELPPEEVARARTDRIDYVHASAPSGSVPSHAFFYLEGYARYESSVGGSVRVDTHVDNRCRSEFSHYHANPFRGDHTAKVRCNAYEPRFYRSGMKVCVPNKCHDASGTVSVRE